MSVMLTKIISSILLSISGLKVVKDISDAKGNLMSFKAIILMILLVIITAITYSTEYNYIYTIIIYIITIFTYKEILNISIIRAILSCGIMIITVIVLDVLAGVITTLFLPTEQAREIWYFNIIINILFIVIMFFIYGNKKVKYNLSKLIKKIENKKAIKIILALILVVITMCIIVSTMTKEKYLTSIFTSNFSLFLVFFILIIFIFDERNNYENLSDDYDNLFSYVQIFEDWIEKEQLTRHEYKNQLAVIRNLTKEKKVRNKIDSIIEDFINIDNKMINQLKYLPNGGLKGLLYYKIATANKDKINITIDIDEDCGTKLLKIDDEKLKNLTKLVGIYTDNAIEAAKETKKKLVTIEIYQIKQNIKIVISNSYNDNNNISNRYQKGASTKGKGRGYGLYFANKMISKNKWLKEEQKIINGFYIQTLFIYLKSKEKM